MAGFQPEIMIVDRPNQNGCHASAIGSQSIRKDLIPSQRSLVRWAVKPFQALADPTGTGLAGMGNAGNIESVAKNLYPVPFAVGNHTYLDLAVFHI